MAPTDRLARQAEALECFASDRSLDPRDEWSVDDYAALEGALRVRGFSGVAEEVAEVERCPGRLN
jgi:hypothetical protein